MKAIGVKRPKNIIANNIGLEIDPRNEPNRIQALFSGNKTSAFIRVITRRIMATVKQKHANSKDFSIYK